MGKAFLRMTPNPDVMKKMDKFQLHKNESKNLLHGKKHIKSNARELQT